MSEASPALKICSSRNPETSRQPVGYRAVIHGLYIFTKDFVFTASYHPRVATGHEMVQASSSWGASILNYAV